MRSESTASTWATRQTQSIDGTLCTEGGLDVGFEILVDINLLIKRFLEGFRVSFGGMKYLGL